MSRLNGNFSHDNSTCASNKKHSRAHELCLLSPYSHFHLLYSQAKKTSFFHSLSERMRMSLITMVRCCQPAHPNSDVQWLNVKRETKKRKKGINFQLTKHKATKNHIELVFLHEKFKSNAFWKTHQDVEERLNYVTSKKSIASFERHDDC